MSYLGRSAKLSLKAQEKVSFLATAGQTEKTGLSYTPSFVEVYVNGVLLTDTTDFTATNGNSITFTVALLVNDEVTVVSLKTFASADHYTKSAADTLLAAKATVANFTSTGIDDNATSTAVTIDASENVGIGVVPEASYPDRPVVRVGSGLGLQCRATGNPSHTWINSNSYQDASTAADKYIGTDQASQIKQTNGAFTFSVAPSGSADAAITWTTGFEVLNDGKARAKNGLLFGTDTAAANTLDDYEEGTWTPTIGGTTTNPSVGYAVQAGVYTKIGNLVHIAVRLNFNSYSGGSGRVHITGLPFTVGSITVSPYAGLTLGLIANINFGASNTQLTTIFDAASTNINFLGLQTSAGYTDLTVSALSVSSTLSLSGSYYV